MNKIFVVRSGYVKSINDEDWHLIDATKIANLYRLKEGEYHLDNEAHMSLDVRYKSDVMPLYARSDGRYQDKSIQYEIDKHRLLMKKRNPNA